MDKKKKTDLKKIFSFNNVLMNRLALADMAGKSFEGKRNLYDVLGYEKYPKISYYISKYVRQDVAYRIINAFPNAIWTNEPVLQEDEDKQNQTLFEKEFLNITKRLKIFHYLNRLDKLSGLGHYAVLFVGVRDGKKPSEPLEGVRGSDDVIFLAPYGEDSATIQSYEKNPSSERYGLPLFYKLQTGGYSGANSSTMPNETLIVHHSRIIHVAEGLLENDILGVPRLQPVINRLDDLEKVVGGSAEIFWLNGRGGLHINTDKDAILTNPEETFEDIENYQHNFSRILATSNMEIKTLELGVHSPKDHVAVLLDLISGATGIPKRLLVGSERGELASSQDENNWTARVKERRDNFCEPLILRPLVDMFMKMGALPKVEDYKVVWPESSSISENEKADISLKKSQALATYVNSSGGDLIVPPEQFVTDILGMDYREEDIENMLRDEDNEIESETND